MTSPRRSTQYLQAGGATALSGANDAPERDQVYILTPAAAAATVTINEGGALGNAVLNLSAAADGASVVTPPLRIRSPYLAAFAGAGATLHVLE
jgi:hypothetical protein